MRRLELGMVPRPRHNASKETCCFSRLLTGVFPGAGFFFPGQLVFFLGLLFCFPGRRFLFPGWMVCVPASKWCLPDYKCLSPPAFCRAKRRPNVAHMFCSSPRCVQLCPNPQPPTTKKISKPETQGRQNNNMQYWDFVVRREHANNPPAKGFDMACATIRFAAGQGEQGSLHEHRCPGNATRRM